MITLNAIVLFFTALVIVTVAAFIGGFVAERWTQR